MTDDTTLQDFIAKHARPYDPETDDYDRPPFAADIKEGKNDPIYNAHSYHTKVPPRGIIPYILHYTEPGDLILDPFCGSGMTGVAALMCADPPSDLLEQFPEMKERVGLRRAILNDLSPAACHIAYNYTMPVDVDALRREFERIKAAVKEEFDWLYGTEHYEPAIGLYDPNQPEVAERLKNPPAGAFSSSRMFKGGPEQTWELLDRAEVERRLGYSVTDLPRNKDWGDLSVSSVEQWVCIPATIQYTIWSDVYRCEGLVTIEEPTGKVSTRGKNMGKPIVKRTRVARGCGKEIVLWHSAVDHEAGEVRESFLCPHCGQAWKKVNLTRVRSQPVVTNYEYVDARGKKRRVEREVLQEELNLLAAIEERPIQYWYPTTPWEETREMWRGGHRDAGIKTVADFYTKRNLVAVSRLWHESGECSELRVRRMLQFAITAFLNRASKLSRIAMSNYIHGGGGPVMSALLGTLYIPSFSVESHVGLLFERREKDLEDIARHFVSSKDSSCVVLKRAASALHEIPDASVDFIFADPPFGSNIFYSDCSILWESWLGELTDTSKEAVWNKSRTIEEGGKTLADYSQLMAASFREMFRVLKPGRWCAIEFNNSDGSVFEVIKSGVTHAGFEIANMLLFDKTQKSFKQVKGAKGEEEVVDKDVLFNLRKPPAIRATALTVDSDLERLVADSVREYLIALPGKIAASPDQYNDDYRTTATINSMLMNVLIPKGVSVERLNLPFIERVCSRYFRKVGQRWYMRGEAVGVQNGSGSLIEEEIAIKDEVSAIEWIRQRLKTGPMLVGELKPLWMRATGLLPAEVSQNFVLDNLLAENFWRDADTNRWREPTDEERERMNDDRSIRVLHDAERFVAGTLRQRTTDAERCEWIDILFQVCKQVEDMEDSTTTPLLALRDFDTADGYRLISQLFQTVLREAVTAEAYSRAEKQARVASQRLSRTTQVETTRTGKQTDSTQMTLDWNGK